MSSRFVVQLALLLSVLSVSGGAAAQEDSTIVIKDGGATEALQSLVVPPIPGAPFSLTLSTEWVKPLGNGGTFTLVNERPMKRDSAGRIYQERWALVPKGSGIKSEEQWIQIADPLVHTLLQCSVRQRVCELLDWRGSASANYQPSFFTSGPMPNGRGRWTHEDLGTDVISGVVVHGYRDTATLNPGVLGNDRPMATVREVEYSAELNLNLRSVLDSPSVGRETFTVTEITPTEPDPAFFLPPAGYSIVDHRRPAPAGR